MADRIADDNDFMEVDVFEDLEIHIQNLVDEDPDEEGALSDDSGCISDHTEYPEDLVERVVPSAQINSLDINTKHCMIEIYYKLEDLNGEPVCTTCMTEDDNSINVGVVHIVRRHQTGSYIELRGVYCSCCRQPTFIEIPCNICPICMPTQ
jgi:hypothetical protein